jgi:hypothetical protein
MNRRVGLYHRRLFDLKNRAAEASSKNLKSIWVFSRISQLCDLVGK